MAKNRSTKKPKANKTPRESKQPAIASNPPSYGRLKPAWRISNIEMQSPYRWESIDAQKLLEIKEKLSNFETMTWNEILIDGKKFHHLVQIAKLSSQAQKRLGEIGQNDIDELVSLRLSNKERVWGILEEGILRLLWWDPLHQVYPYQLKNT